MTWEAKVSGTWKALTPSVKVSGAWKDLSEGWVKVSGVWKQFYAPDSGGGVSIPNPSCAGVAESYAFAQFSFKRNGTVTNEFTGNLETGVGDWVSPKTSVIGDSYWIRVTPTSGSMNLGNATGVWLQLSTTRQWGVETSTIPRECICTIEISIDAIGSTIVGTRTGVSVSAETFL